MLAWLLFVGELDIKIDLKFVTWLSLLMLLSAGAMRNGCERFELPSLNETKSYMCVPCVDV